MKKDFKDKYNFKTNNILRIITILPISPHKSVHNFFKYLLGNLNYQKEQIQRNQKNKKEINKKEQTGNA